MRFARVLGALLGIGVWVGMVATADEPAQTTAGANTACVNGCTLPLGHIIRSKGNSYEVLSPWSQIDPPPLRPISPRLTELDGKTIGLFINMKRAAAPIQAVVEEKLKEKYPRARFTKFHHRRNNELTGSEQWADFQRWVNTVDAVIAAVGDCGSCTKFVAYNAVLAEDAGKPTVALCNEDFVRGGKATVEKIAVNAVMAGCLPTHMPVLIAGVEALVDRQAGFGTTSVSTASWAPFWVINGPIRHDLHVNSGAGALSPGDMANAAIGRAMGLIIKNIGGIRKGVEDTGIYGNPGKYTMVTGENEEQSPWQPLQVQQGFKKEDSTVTLSFPTRYAWTMLPGSDADKILSGIINGVDRNGIITVMVNPQHARSLASAGWDKEKITASICEKGRKRSMRGRLKTSEIRVIVAGGSGRLGVCILSGGGSWATQRVTKKIALPKNWDDLVARYKDLVPSYEGQ